MKRIQTIAKVNELLKEDVTAQFDEQEERTAVNGNMHFLVSNSKGLAVQVEMDYDEDEDVVSYRINETEWAK